MVVVVVHAVVVGDSAEVGAVEVEMAKSFETTKSIYYSVEIEVFAFAYSFATDVKNCETVVATRRRRRPAMLCQIGRNCVRFSNDTGTDRVRNY